MAAQFDRRQIWVDRCTGHAEAGDDTTGLRQMWIVLILAAGAAPTYCLMTRLAALVCSAAGREGVRYCRDLRGTAPSALKTPLLTKRGLDPVFHLHKPSDRDVRTGWLVCQVLFIAGLFAVVICGIVASG